jgi:proteasome alpha subunit
LLDEPYRYLEAVSNRRDYVEDQLRQGSPIVSLQYDDGILLLTIGRGQRKIYEIHNHIVLAAIGHTADIERLRLLATDAASVQGFQSSVDDVTLHRLTNFLLAPTIKREFETIFSSPIIAKMLLVELGGMQRESQFISLNYDGTTQVDQRTGVLAGNEEIESAMRAHLSDISQNLSLQAAFELALETWAIGRHHSLQDNNNNQDDEDDGDEDVIEKKQLREAVQEAREQGEIEVGILDVSRRSKSKFCLLPTTETDAMLESARDKL